MKDFDYRKWLAVASRHSRRKSESADLLHDALLDAIRGNRTDFSTDATQRWFAGVIRNRSAMMARTAARRRTREARERKVDRSSAPIPPRSFIDSLPPAARSIATLIVAGLNREEIIAALKIAPTAFRQRLTTIRKHWGRHPKQNHDDAVESDLPDFGLMRRALLSQVQRVGGLGTHDPDGHLLIISNLARSQSPRRRQQKQKEDKP